MPVLTYYDKVSGVTIWRSSQPCTGMFGGSNKHDEEMLRLIGLCNSSWLNSGGFVEIYDARPLLNARANKLRGGGYEDCGMSRNY